MAGLVPGMIWNSLLGFLGPGGTLSTFVGNALTLVNNGFFQIGPNSGTNVVEDTTSIQARNNGATATLALQPLGGATTAGGSLQAVGLTSTAGVAAGGALTGATTGVFSGIVKSNGGYLPPTYDISGNDPSGGSGCHLIMGSISVPNGGATVTLSGKSVYTSSISYVVVAVNGNNTANESANVVTVSGTQFSIYLNGGSTTQTFNFIGIGW